MKIQFESRKSTAFVTGAAGGIGTATVSALCKKGITVIAIDSSHESLTELVEKSPGKVIPFQLDISNWETAEKAITEMTSEYGVPDFLVNGAGINPLIESSELITHQFYSGVIDINLAGTFLFCKTIIPLMASKGRGAVVNISSIAGLRGWGGSSIYSASKGAIIALTMSLATEYGHKGIRINAVCPGSIRTPMVIKNLQEKKDLDKGMIRIAEKHPLGRIGEPIEVANAISFLLSDEASFITGAMLTVDGGLSAS